MSSRSSSLCEFGGRSSASTPRNLGWPEPDSALAGAGLGVVGGGFGRSDARGGISGTGDFAGAAGSGVAGRAEASSAPVVRRTQPGRVIRCDELVPDRAYRRQKVYEHVFRPARRYSHTSCRLAKLVR